MSKRVVMEKRGFIGGQIDGVKEVIISLGPYVQDWYAISAMKVSGPIELVTRMRREAFSRNRNFDSFAAQEHSVRARRIWRYLNALERELLAFGRGDTAQIRVETIAEEGKRIIIEVPKVRMRRVALLDSTEYHLLRERDELRALLDAAECDVVPSSS